MLVSLAAALSHLNAEGRTLERRLDLVKINRFVAFGPAEQSFGPLAGGLGPFQVDFGGSFGGIGHNSDVVRENLHKTAANGKELILFPLFFDLQLAES
jgi:hypothetical protein